MQGGIALKGTKINFSPDANIFAQLMTLVREVEGHPFIAITEDMFQVSGRRAVEAVLATLDPANEPVTKKNRKTFTADKFAPMTGWCMGFAQDGDILFDGTK